MKVIDVVWFTSQYGNSGIALVEDKLTKKRKLLAGSVSGLNQEMDEKILIDWGSKVSIPMLQALIDKVPKKESTKKKKVKAE
ncbi:hypothetical protein LCGC14_1866070 [marine sediment metagenome]|uniref:Uncharacterized protein n=1 Tax=marine sediment metagenome TaxID=412755 RepID=A0A0F9G6G6_9ZZZZ